MSEAWGRLEEGLAEPAFYPQDDLAPMVFGLSARFERLSAERYDSESCRERITRSAKIAVTINRETLTRLDRLVREQWFPNRSKAVHEALCEKLDRRERSRLDRECAKLDPVFAQQLADEGLAEDNVQ